MNGQTFQQRRAERAYCSVQQMSKPWTGEPVGYHPEVPEPELEVQPARWADAAPILCVVAMFAGLLLGLRMGGVL